MDISVWKFERQQTKYRRQEFGEALLIGPNAEHAWA
jgi:hypothetical protein